MTSISLKRGFYLTLHAAAGQTEQEKCYEMFYIFKLSLTPLNLVKHINRSDFKISKQISPVIAEILLKDLLI